MDFIQIIKFLGFVVEGILAVDVIPAQLLRDGYSYWTVVLVTTWFNALHFAGVIGLIVSRHWVAALVKKLRNSKKVAQSNKMSKGWQKFLQKIKPVWLTRVQKRNGVYKRRIMRVLKTGGYTLLV